MNIDLEYLIIPILILIGIFFGKFISATPIIIIALIVALVIAFITFKNPGNGLFILVFSMLLSPRIPIMNVPGRSVDLRIDDFLIIAVFIAWIVYIATNKDWKGFVKTPLDFPLLALLTIYILSTGLGIMRGNISAIKAIFYILKYFEYFIIYWLTANIIHSTKEIPRYLKAGLITSLIVAIFGYSLMGRVDRIYAPFDTPMDMTGGEPATLGGYLLIIMSLALAFFVTAQNKVYFYLALFLFMIPPLIMTLSRATMFAFAVLILTFLIITPRKKMAFFIMIMMGTALFPVLLPSIYRTMSARVAYTFTGTDPQSRKYKIGTSNVNLEGSAAERVQSWKNAFTVWLPKHPFFGHGITGVGLADSQIPLFLGEIGLIGFFTFAYILFIIYKTSFYVLKNSVLDIDKALAIGLITALTALLAQTPAVNTFIIVRIMEPFWFLTALVVGIIYPEMEDQRAAEQKQAT